MLRFKGSQHFRQRLVCSTLSGRPIRIDDIRAADPENPGLRDFEASFLRLLEKLTNGCVVEINETGAFSHVSSGSSHGSGSYGVGFENGPCQCSVGAGHATCPAPVDHLPDCSTARTVAQSLALPLREGPRSSPPKPYLSLVPLSVLIQHNYSCRHRALRAAA